MTKITSIKLTRCSDIVDKHFKNSKVKKTFSKGPKPTTHSSQGGRYFGKYHKSSTLGSNLYKNYNLSSYDAGLHANRTSGHYKTLTMTAMEKY